MLKRPACFQAEGKIWFSNIDAPAIGLFAELRYQIYQRVAVIGIGARRPGGAHTIDVVFAAKKSQQHVLVAHADTTVFLA